MPEKNMPHCCNLAQSGLEIAQLQEVPGTYIYRWHHGPWYIGGYSADQALLSALRNAPKKKPQLLPVPGEE